jgi:hypothetical protein
MTGFWQLLKAARHAQLSDGDVTLSWLDAIKVGELGERLEIELEKWKTNHTEECTRIARTLIEDQCRTSIDRVADLEDRIATMLSLVQDHSEMIEQFDTFKARMDAAAQDGGT